MRGLLVHGSRALGASIGAPWPDVARSFLRLVWTSAPVVIVVAFFAGAMLTVQAAASLAPFGGAAFAGVIVGFGGMREVFPLLAAASVAARAGAEIASELGSMRTGHQIDALEVMGLDPYRVLVGPRLLGGVLGTPLCVLASCAAGMLGAFCVGHFQLGIDRGAMWASLWSTVVRADVFVALGKGVVLGGLLALVSTHEGLRAEGGAAGVGRATNRAVIRSMIAVTLGSLLGSALVYGRGP